MGCLQLLQVSLMQQGSAEGLGLQRCWIDMLSTKLPVLAVAVDDALLQCAERLVAHWRRPGV